MTTNRNELLQILATTIADYREGSVSPRTPELINEWLQQFPGDIQEPLLAALVHAFKKTYISKDKFKAFLAGLASTDKLSPGSKPIDYWRRTNFLKIQKGGNSQQDILATFNEVLQATHGLNLRDAGSTGGDFVYLDDCVGTGSRVRSDVCAWLESDAPPTSVLHVITPVLYLGSFWIEKKIQETATAVGKTLVFHKWSLETFQMENRKAYRDKSDVL